jgi:hypothetical protein
MSLFTLVVLIITVSCDDPFSIFLQNVPAEPSETTLFDFIGGRLQDPPAYDIIFARPVRVDQSRNWDFLFQISASGPEFLPFSAATDSVTDSGLKRMGDSFAGVLEAPTDGYVLSDPMPISVGDVLVARSRTDPSSFLQCSRYAKLEVLDIDLLQGNVTFRHLSNPNCGDTVLEPGKHGSI